MPELPERPSSWRRGRLDGRPGPAGLIFGRMYEDPEVEVTALMAAGVPAGAPVFCIASAGCTALALAARGHVVTAVDVNPAQVAYLEERLSGEGPRDGQVERLLALGRRRLRLLGADEGALREFLMLEGPAAQVAMWRDHPDAPRWRGALHGVLAALAARVPGEGAASPGDEIEQALHARFERGLARHPNRTNPYLWRLLLGEGPPSGPRAWDRGDVAAPGSVAARVADALAFLEAAPAGHFCALSLSNLEDVLPPSQARRLRRAAARAARPGAVLITRSLAEARTREEAAWAVRDRTFLWGRIRVATVSSHGGRGRWHAGGRPGS